MNSYMKIPNLDRYYMDLDLIDHKGELILILLYLVTLSGQRIDLMSSGVAISVGKYTRHLICICEVWEEWIVPTGGEVLVRGSVEKVLAELPNILKEYKEK